MRLAADGIRHDAIDPYDGQGCREAGEYPENLHI